MLYPKSPTLYSPLPCPAPQRTHSCFLALAFPCTGAYDLCKTKGLSSHWWPTRPSSATYATRDTSFWGIMVSSYCCSFYRVSDPFSSLGTFSSSFIGGPGRQKYLFPGSWVTLDNFLPSWKLSLPICKMGGSITVLTVKSRAHSPQSSGRDLQVGISSPGTGSWWLSPRRGR